MSEHTFGTIKQASNGWEHHTVTFTFQAHRIGWRGVWDALCSAISDKARISVPTDITFSAYLKPGQKPSIVQVETGQEAGRK